MAGLNFELLKHVKKTNEYCQIHPEQKYGSTLIFWIPIRSTFFTAKAGYEATLENEFYDKKDLKLKI